MTNIYVYEKLKSKPYLKKHLGLKVGIRQYMMYLLFIISLAILIGEVQVYGMSVITEKSNRDVRKSYYVTQDGSDLNPGTKKKPFATIQKAVDMMVSGYRCVVRAGTYHENVKIKDLRGRPDDPISIIAYPGEKVVLDGTKPIKDLKKTEWTLHQGNIYKTQLTEDVWQLFIDDEMMISARWPNAHFEDGSVWDQEKHWGHVGMDSVNGKLVSSSKEGHPGLAATGKDYTGAMLVNSIWWMTRSEIVKEHSAGSNTLFYDGGYRNGYLNHPMFWSDWIKQHQYYFLECHLNCLDSAKEWYYNPKTKELYLWSPDGKKPKGDIRGKVLDWAFDIEGCEYLTLSGFKFFGCTFRMLDASHSTVEDCDFEDFNYSKRMLGIRDTWKNNWGEQTVSTVIKGSLNGSYNTLRNCTFAYSDGAAFLLEGRYDLVENVLAHDIDWTGVGYNTFQVTGSENSIFRRMEAYNTGASECLMPGYSGLVEFCDFGARLGVLQHDGSAIQIAPSFQSGTIVRNTWVHDNTKFGIRADFNGIPGEIFPVGFGFEVSFHHNVVWGQHTVGYQPGFWVGGDRHKIYNNLSYGNIAADMTLWSKDGANMKTEVCNNAVGKLTGERGGKLPMKSAARNNFEGDVSEQVRVWENRDFRPREGSKLVDGGSEVYYFGTAVTGEYSGVAPDIGPYEYDCESYWIPGFQGKEASKPIPADGADNAKVDCDLIWLGGYKGVSHDVYFGTDFKRVERAGCNSKEYKGNQKNNIFSPEKLRKGVDYYWRIDTIVKSGVVKGDVWRFRARD